jgi:hypothetical protein
MAELKYCPHCDTSRECTKKGTNSSGKQRWYCKTCKKTFLPTTATSASSKVKKTKVKKSLTETDIIVNNNIIKTVPGFISLDQAFDLTKSYFREIAKEKAEIQENSGKRTITFKVTAGVKG